jgi:hypothetical protein
VISNSEDINNRINGSKLAANPIPINHFPKLDCVINLSIPPIIKATTPIAEIVSNMVGFGRILNKLIG